MTIEADPTFVRDGQLWTSAGFTAGMDLALALIEDDEGHAVAVQSRACWSFSSSALDRSRRSAFG